MSYLGEGYFDVVKLLVEAGARLDIVTFSGKTAAVRALLTENVSICEYLIERGTPVNIPFREKKYTILHVAAESGHCNLVELILKAGCDPNCTTREGNTPLHYAATNGKIDAARMLLLWGADVNRVGQMGSTPLICAYGHAPMLSLLLRYVSCRGSCLVEGVVL